MAVGPAAGAFAFNKRAGQHFAERTEAANEPATQFQVGFAGRLHMTPIIVSEVDEVKHSWRFARMPQTEVGMENPANYRADADATPTLRNHWSDSQRFLKVSPGWRQTADSEQVQRFTELGGS